MEFFKNLSTLQQNVLKFGGVFLLGAVAVMALSGNTGLPLPQFSMSKEADYMENQVSSDAYYGAPELSVRNVEGGGIMPPIDPTYTPGADTEDYEVKQYSISFESRNKDKECVAVRDLLNREDVVFENTNEYESGCSYSFKVKKESVETVLALLDTLNPKEVNENAYTIKREVTDDTSEMEILEKKLAAITTTLTESLATYDSLIAKASAQGDVASLAQLTDSKLNLLERLTMSQIDINAQLDRLNRAKTDALDQLVYTQFNVSVYENKFINGKEIGDSWTAAIQTLFRDINNFAQEVSLGFVALLFTIVKYALYGVVLLFVARFGYNFAKKVWVEGGRQ